MRNIVSTAPSLCCSLHKSNSRTPTAWRSCSVRIFLLFCEVVDTTSAALEALNLNRIARTREYRLLKTQKCSSMRSIPNELLTKVFSHCFRTDRGALDPRVACRRWRNLPTDLPQLCTHLFRILDLDKQRGHITGRQCANKVGWSLNGQESITTFGCL